MIFFIFVLCLSEPCKIEENRQIDPVSLVVTVGVFPPRQKGLIARQSTEIRLLHSTPLTKLFDRIHCPHSLVSLRHGSEFAENPGSFSMKKIFLLLKLRHKCTANSKREISKCIFILRFNLLLR